MPVNRRPRTESAVPAGPDEADAPAWAVAQHAALVALITAESAARAGDIAALRAYVTALDTNQTAARRNGESRRGDPQCPVLLKAVVRTGGPLPVGTVPVLPDAANGLHVEAAHVASWHGLSQLTGPELNVLFNIYQEPAFGSGNARSLAQRREAFAAFLL